MNPTRRSIIGGIGGSITVAEAHARGFFGRGGSGVGVATLITGATITPASFVGGSADGTPVGSISVQTTGASFTGTIAIAAFGQGADFKLSSTSLPSSLELNGTQAAGAYSIKLTLTDATFPNSPFTTSAIAITGSSGSILLTSITEVNDTVSNYSANTRWIWFGHIFKDGDIQPGDYPFLQVSGVTQPISTVGSENYFPSGCLRFFGGLIRPTYSLNAGLTQDIGIWTGGVAPTASARTTAEIYSENISVQLTSAPVTGANITGDWGSWLNGDANSGTANVYLDGDAGKVWRQRASFAQTVGGAKHGQLECYHYFAGLTASGGSYAGCSHVARVTQPWYNQNTPAKNWRAFSTATWQYGSGPTITNFLGPCNDGSMATADFTWSTTTHYATTAANKFYSGAADLNLVAGYLTTTGSLPTPNLTTTGIYFLQSSRGAGNAVFLNIYSNNGSSGYVSSTGAGSGTNTFNPVYMCVHFGSFSSHTANAEWNIFQGAGSVASPVYSRTKFDLNYWLAAGLIQPINQSLIGTITASTFAYGWNSASIGPLTQYQPTTSPRPDIQPLSGFFIRYLYSQDKVDALVIRMIGLAGMFNCGASFKDYTTDTVPNISNADYTGLPAHTTAQKATCWPNTGASQNWGFPPAANLTYPFNSTDYSHKPEMGLSAYMLTGRSDYLDIVADSGQGGLLSQSPITQRNPTQPHAAYAIGCAWSASIRGLSWSMRDLYAAADLLPATFPDGSQLTTYYNDLASAALTWLATAGNTTNMLGSYVVTNGMWAPSVITVGTGPANNICQQTSWEMDFFVSSMCFHYGMSGDANALAFLTAAGATRLLYQYNTFGRYTLYNYYDHSCTPIASSGVGTSSITSDAQYGIVMPGTISWTTSSPAFTVTVATTWGWTPTAGDMVMFNSYQALPSGYSGDTPYWLRDVTKTGATTWTCNLAATSGGSAIAPPSGAGGPQSGFNYCLPQKTSVGATATPTSNYQAGYTGSVLRESCWLEALGITSPSLGVLSPVSADAAATIIAGGADHWNTDPSLASQPTF